MKAAVVMAAWLAAINYWATRGKKAMLDEAMATDEWRRWVAAGRVTEYRLHPSNPAWRPVDGPRALN